MQRDGTKRVEGAVDDSLSRSVRHEIGGEGRIDQGRKNEEDADEGRNGFYRKIEMPTEKEEVTKDAVTVAIGCLELCEKSTN